MPKSSSPSPTITPMNPIKPHPQTLTLTPNPTDDDDDYLLDSYPILPQSLLMDDDDEPDPDPAAPASESPFASLLFRDPEDDDGEDEDEEDDDEIEDRKPPLDSAPRVDPSAHISSQFYTFNRDSHSLMARCILEGRLSTPDEIRAATPPPVLASWRSVWKDRNEETAYLTAWKRIQDKLTAADAGGLTATALYFKSNPLHRVPHLDQWQDIVDSSHKDPDLLQHLGLKDTIDRVKQSWTVGAKLYGIPESFIRVCVASCPTCNSSSSSTTAGNRSKRRRFEYTESFEFPASDVPRKLLQLAHQHKVVLCIRQKYIRYKPFMAEVKDYACHRAGEPTSASASGKRARALKREPYQSKRCGCGFRIRAIVPIANYNEKDKTFVYQEEGNAVFKLYAVHSGHEPGPLDGSARIVHRVVGQKGFFDPEPVLYGVREEMDHDSFISMLAKDDGSDAHHHTVFQQVQEIRVEVGLLEGKIGKMSVEAMGSLSRQLSDILLRLRSVGESEHREEEERLVVGDLEANHWGSEHGLHLDMHNRMFSKGNEIIEEEEADFGSSLGPIVTWDRMPVECRDTKMLIRESCKPGKWAMKEHHGEFDEKSILNCSEESKLVKPVRLDGTIVTDPSLVGMQVDGFYTDNTKWFDSPSGLDSSAQSEDGGFQHRRIV